MYMFTHSMQHPHALRNRQRFLRPPSPHFTIYQPQLTWIASPRDGRRADFPAVRLRAGVTRRAGHLRQRARRGVRRHAARGCQVRGKGAAGCAVCAPRAEWHPPFELGFDKV
ncbi:hypothetical protein C8J57DRAFT_534459 [Mycena rebaudengoi]|nr:hypothetical protein C8J57DRAFT_534459 [Mycena rebaudengoi]